MTLTIAAACGSNDDATVEAGSAVVAVDGSPTQTLVGATGLLVIELDTRAVVQLSPTTDGGLRRQADTSLGGEGAIVNVSGVQLADGTWIVAGNDCDSTETVDPEGCTPGTTTVAIVDGDTARTVEDVPDEFEQTFVTVRGASSSEVLFETWDGGASSYWTLSQEGHTFTQIEWKPRQLEVPDQTLTDDDLDDLQPVRTSCIIEDHILVIDGIPNGSALEATANLIHTTTGQLVVDGMDLEFAPNVVLDRLLCAQGAVPQLVAVDHGTNQPLAYDLAVDTGSVEAGSPVEAPPAPGPLIDITYGPSSVAIQFMAGPPEVTLDEPDSPDDVGAVTSTSEVGVVMFDSDSWDRVIDAGDGSVRLGERVYPLPESTVPLVVQSVRSGEYRVVG